MIGTHKITNLSPSGFILKTYPGVDVSKSARNAHKTQFKNTIQNMSSSTPPCKTGRHGGARSVLCWQEKLSQMDESAIIAFLSQFNCGCKNNCSHKIRDIGQTDATKVILDLRTERMAGQIMKPVCSDDALEKNTTAVFCILLIASPGAIKISTPRG